MELANLLYDIKSGKFNLIFYFIFFIFIFHIYDKLSTCYKITENMADVSEIQIENAVKQYYLSDEFIKNISLVSAQIQQNGLKIPGNLEITGSFNLLPKGTIVAFNSDKAPNGWALCDGTNGTPDLRGRFIRMQSDSLGGYNEWVGKVLGGNVTAYEKSIGGNSRDDPNSWMLNHKFGDRAGTDHHQLHINELPPHSHIINSDYKLMRPNTYKRGLSSGGYDGYDAGGGSTQPISANSVGTTNAGAGWGHNNQPPYYVLSYIMKL